ncbi:DUF4873 domain-containing protein [Nocardioides terrisoli]|uniref:DUF4873 domain-containing protein n=1 Tax=Nocardioides terrisoli TaxID=3388267 RepID=UPI00287BB391|nr:DUF4873 domain-containing protein [Nocardioides marmorisolisilvae]
MPEREPREEYDGPATLVTDESGVEVTVRLRGHFEPIDGRFHWWGRITADRGVEDHFRSGDTIVLRTPYGDAPARLSDVDPWGRFRIAGTGRPPF